MKDDDDFIFREKFTNDKKEKKVKLGSLKRMERMQDNDK